MYIVFCNDNPSDNKEYNTMRGAKIARSKLGNDYGLLSSSIFQQLYNRPVEVEFINPHDNIKRKVTINQMDIGTVNDPRREIYWTM